MTIKPLIGLVALAAIGLAACGSDNSSPAPAAAPVETIAPAAPAAAPAASPVAVKVADSTAGKILIGADGRTLYGFTNDVGATSTCYSTCASAWPPVLVSGEWAVGPGLDFGVFSTITRQDGTSQLVAGKFPLYEYSGDAVPGDLNGQGSGDVWFVVGTDAKLVTGAAGGETAASAPATTAAPAPVASVMLADTPLGKVIVDAEGRTLYGFANDKDGASTCNGNCAKAWPAATITGEPVPGDGITAPLSVVDAPGGGKMLKAGKWPLYRFSGDTAAGDINGQGSGGVWFVVGADGKFIKG
jgi:predicted lipoprotein with Yx(FWY)xxD motif